MLRAASLWVLAALAAGIAVGAAAANAGAPGLIFALEQVEAFGSLWLNTLRMTVVPLVFALLVTGVAKVADAAASGKTTLKALGLFAGLLILAIAYGVFATEAVLSAWPVDPAGAEALRAGASGGAAPAAEPASFRTWLLGLVPANPVQAAAESAMLPLVVFALFFGFAAARLPSDLRAPLATLFQAVAEAMIVIVRWVLLAAPAGVFALALGIGLRAGAGIAGVLFQYVAIVAGVIAGTSLLAYAAALVLGRVAPARFARAALGPQAVAVSTQSSLASLPAMIAAAREGLGLKARVIDLVLPLAVAVFRMTSPVGNLAVVLFVAHIYGIAIEPGAMVAAGVVAFAISIGTVGLPGQVSFFASIAPICLALGVPIELLPVLLAVEVVPDIFRTLGNVTADVAAAAIVDRWTSQDDAEEAVSPAGEPPP